jgi:hypothetical protein
MSIISYSFQDANYAFWPGAIMSSVTRNQSDSEDDCDYVPPTHEREFSHCLWMKDEFECI